MPEKLKSNCLPLVSVCVITYNHNDYIAQCLDSVLMQQTTFPFEVILGEDESSDGTRELCIEYANDYPDKIKLFLRSRKDVIYINGKPTGRHNLIQSLKAATGKYVAILEGDDYWIDPHKLQKQIDFLESDGEKHSFCFHQGLRINEVTSQYDVYPHLTVNSLNSKEFFALPTIPVGSIVFRNSIKLWIPEDHSQGDFLILCNLMSNGKAYFINEVMSVYRKHPAGISFNNKSFDYLKRRVECLRIEARSKEFSREVREQIQRIFNLHTRQLISTYKRRLSFFSYLKYLYWLYAK